MTLLGPSFSRDLFAFKGVIWKVFGTLLSTCMETSIFLAETVLVIALRYGFNICSLNLFLQLSNVVLKGGTILGPPTEVVDLGATEISQEIFHEYLESLSETSFL